MNLKIKLIALFNLLTETRILLKCKKEVYFAQKRLDRQRKRVKKLRNELRIFKKKKKHKKGKK